MLPSLEYYHSVVPGLLCRVSEGPGEGCLSSGAGRWILLGRGSFEQWGECSRVHQCVVFYDLKTGRIDLTFCLTCYLLLAPGGCKHAAWA